MNSIQPTQPNTQPYPKPEIPVNLDKLREKESLTDMETVAVKTKSTNDKIDAYIAGSDTEMHGNENSNAVKYVNEVYAKDLHSNIYPSDETLDKIQEYRDAQMQALAKSDTAKNAYFQNT